MNDFICDVFSNFFISIRKVESIEEDAVFHAFEIVLSIICFQSILVIEFIGSHEGLELEVLIFDKLGQFFQKFRTVLLNEGCFDIVVFNKVVDFIRYWIKGHGIWHNIFFEESIQGFFIFMKHDLTVNWTVDFIIKTEVGYVFKWF